jgi:hypothetical protein
MGEMENMVFVQRCYREAERFSQLAAQDVQPLVHFPHGNAPTSLSYECGVKAVGTNGMCHGAAAVDLYMRAETQRSDAVRKALGSRDKVLLHLLGSMGIKDEESGARERCSSRKTCKSHL